MPPSGRVSPGLNLLFSGLWITRIRRFRPSKIDRMSSAVEVGRSAVGLADAPAAVDALLAVDLTGDADAALLDSVREVERLSRRLAAVGTR